MRCDLLPKAVKLKLSSFIVKVVVSLPKLFKLITSEVSFMLCNHGYPIGEQKSSNALFGGENVIRKEKEQEKFGRSEHFLLFGM